MAVQAPQHLLNPPAFLPHHDIGHAFRALEGAAVGASGGGGGFFDDIIFGGCAPAPPGDAQPRSELTCNGGSGVAGGGSNVFLPRKRARVAPPFLDDGSHPQQGLVLPLPVTHGQVFAGDVQSRALGGCGAASTSGRAASSRSSTTRAWRSMRWCTSRRRGCARGCRRHAVATRARWWRPWSARRPAGSGRWSQSWSAPGAGTRSWRSGFGRWRSSARTGCASPGATRPSPRASAPRSTSCSCSSSRPPPPEATAGRPRTRSPAASRRRHRRGSSPTMRRPGAAPRRQRARPAAAATRACCSSRAGTCACAARASPPPRSAPSAPPPRTPRSRSCCDDDGGCQAVSELLEQSNGWWNCEGCAAPA